jgi:DNA-binding transcriptional regulator GbsR (MarR family)
MPTVNTNYVTKTQAIMEVMQATGYGRFVIEKKMSELIGAGLIRLVDDPGDRRRQMISRDQVQIIIDALTLK